MEYSTLSKYVFDLIEKEAQRQEDEICLIASENYTSKDVMKAQGSVLTNKYAEGYVPGKNKTTGEPTYRRYYAGCEIIDKIEAYAVDKCKELFGCKYAYVQPHSGSQANQAVYLALCNPGDKILGMSLDEGGHLTHGAKVSSSGKIYNAIPYGIDDNGIINYEEIKQKLKQNPRILIVGASAYPRAIDFKKIRELIDEHNTELKDNFIRDEKQFMTHLSAWGEAKDADQLYEENKCYMMVDMAHIAGLIASGLHESPIGIADVITSTTHKTLRGPRGGIILTNDVNIAKKINSAVFPGLQGGPLEHVIAGKAICFEEALDPSFKDYCARILKNMKAMEKVFKENAVDMVSDGTDNHLILLDLRKYNVSGASLEKRLEEIGIVCNKNAVKNDPKPKMKTSGVRIGSAAATTRGFTEDEFEFIAKMIVDEIKDLSENKAVSLAEKKEKVKEMCHRHPIYN